MELQQKFNELKDKWEKETGFLSSSSAIINNESYKAIIELGKEIVPLMLKDLQDNGPNFWFFALFILTKYEIPLETKDQGNMQKITELWLEWGRKHNYIKEED